VRAAGEAPDETKGWSAQKLYNEAKDNLNNRSYETAIKYLREARVALPVRALRAAGAAGNRLRLLQGQRARAGGDAAERFIKLHPNHPNVDYAYYLKGLANFNGDLGWLGYISGQDLSERDPKAAREAFDAFKDLAARYPDSKYAPDAVARMNYLVNALASHEVHVARYYLKRGAYVAAANRAQFAIKTYPQAPANEEGLVILVKAYDAMKMTDLRNDAERVLMKNFPDSKYLKGDPRRASTPWWQIWNW
jgi:outer membrane protein assembly factor BamD